MVKVSAKEILLEIIKISGESYREIGRKTGVHYQTIANVINTDMKANTTTYDALDKYLDEVKLKYSTLEELQKQIKLLEAHNTYLTTRLKIAETK
jgi:bacterioferritin (cytochrome b1)